MPSAPVVPCVLFAAGLLFSWGCAGLEEDTPAATSGFQVVVLAYEHGSYATGDEIDVACLTAGRQGDHTTGGGCDCLHLHSDGPGIGFNDNPGPYQDTDMEGCGHGCMKVVGSTATIDAYCGGLHTDDPNHPRRGLCLQSPCSE